MLLIMLGRKSTEDLAYACLVEQCWMRVSTWRVRLEDLYPGQYSRSWVSVGQEGGLFEAEVSKMSFQAQGKTRKGRLDT